MKISICIPQYNRIEYLLKSLSIIQNQLYTDIEIVVSDDCSTDNTESEIKALIPIYKYHIIYHRNSLNKGYDRNYRQSIELATGDYCLVIGNDDSLNGNDAINSLVKFLTDNNYPDIGFCNMIEERSGNKIIERALSTKVIGKGAEIALNYYSSFSFVGGLIYKRDTFIRFNSSKYDGSIYAQMYLGLLMIASGCSLFSIKEPLVIKDLYLKDEKINSYVDKIAKKWSDFKVVDGGLPSVINVLINGLADAECLTQSKIRFIFQRMYALTYPHWILDFKANQAFPEAVGLIIGMNPFRNNNYIRLNIINRGYIICIYLFSSIIALITPAILFKKYKQNLYKVFKK